MTSQDQNAKHPSPRLLLQPSRIQVGKNTQSNRTDSLLEGRLAWSLYVFNL